MIALIPLPSATDDHVRSGWEADNVAAHIPGLGNLLNSKQAMVSITPVSNDKYQGSVLIHRCQKTEVELLHVQFAQELCGQTVVVPYMYKVIELLVRMVWRKLYREFKVTLTLF